MGPSAATEAEPASRLEWRHEWAVAGLTALWVVLIAFWFPITHLGTHTFGPWDWLAQSSPLTELPPPAGVKTRAMEDPVRQMIPWALYARGELARGEVPLWNPLNGTGIPLLANYQSAVFSPFTLPYYLLPLGLATLVAGAAKLAAAAAGTFLFLRQLGRSRWAAAFGASGYALCCFHRTCTLHPHVGVLALLPFALLASELAFARFALDPSRVPLRELAWLALALGALVFAGHPESLLFAVYLTAAYSAFRLAGAWIAERRAGRAAPLKLALCVGLFGVAGAGLGAAQIAPFAEYLSHSAATEIGERDVEFMEPRYLALQLFPNLAGSPRDEPWIHHALRPHYHESNAFHVGGLYALAALGALLFLARERRSWVFVGLGACVLLYAFDAPVLKPLLRPAFGGHFVPAPRSAPVWVLSACALAALTLDALLPARGAVPRWRGGVFVAASAGVVLLARHTAAGFWSELRARAPAEFAQLEERVLMHVDLLSLALLAGLGALALHLVLTRAWSRQLAYAGLFGAAALCGELSFSGYVPTVEDRYVLPQSEAVAGLQRDLAGERLVMLSPAALRTNANLFYGVDLLTSYDAVEIRELDALRTEIYGYGGYQAISTKASRRGLDLFGVRYVATRAEWLPLDTERCRQTAPDAERMWPLAAEIGIGAKRKMVELSAEDPPYAQDFSVSKDGFDGLVLHFLDDPGTHAVRARVTLVDAASGALLAERISTLAELRLLTASRRECVLRFTPLEASAGRAFALRVELSDIPPGGVVRLFRARGARSDGSEAEEDTGESRSPQELSGPRRALGARALLDASYDQSAFERVGEYGGFVLHRYREGRGRAWAVSGAEVEAEPERALQRVLAEEFDPLRSVLLEAGSARTPDPAARIEVRELERGARRSAWSFSANAPGHLVVAQPFYPGWSATLDGRPVPLLRANHAFCAVELPAGAGRVELRYAPTSFRWGAAVSLATLALLALVLLRERRRLRAR